MIGGLRQVESAKGEEMSRSYRSTAALLLLAAVACLAAPVGASAETGPRTVYLIRHGEYDHDRTQDEDTGRGLVELGRRQAEVLSDRLAEMPLEFTWNRLSPGYSSRPLLNQSAIWWSATATSFAGSSAGC